MQGLHCPECGATRWRLLPVENEGSRECTVCGAEMEPERRRPGRGPAQLADERREAPALT